MHEKTIKVVEYQPQSLLGLPDQIKDYIFSNRNITDVDQLDYSIKNLIDPSYFKDLDKAIRRLVLALIENDSVVIIGDYDADGATSTALMYMSLKQLGFTNVAYIIPDRVIHGYGLSPILVDTAVKEYNANLIVTVDNGISSFEGVSHANELGVDVVITDHHLGGAQVPAAVAIINPNQKGCNFPSKNLAGVGVAYYFMKVLTYYIHHEYDLIAQGVHLSNAIILSQLTDLDPEKKYSPEEIAHFRKVKDSLNLFIQNYRPEFSPDIYLDLVAIGTVADLATLDYNNRILVEQGIRRIRAGVCTLGIAAILKVQKVKYVEFSTDDISFKVAPLINAMGRMEHMAKGVQCLISEDYHQAEQIACEMHALNQRRSSLQAENSESALAQFNYNLKVFEDRVSICLFDASWHQGLIGLNSSVIKEKFWKPTFVFATDDSEEGVIKGSGRSINNLHIKDCLDLIAQRYPGLILKFGGHSGAAGVSIRKENFQQFALAFDEVVREKCSPDDIGCETIYCDLELPVNYLTIEFAKEIARLGPWGKGFPEPVFRAKFKISETKLVGKAKRDTLILELLDANNISHKAIKFKASPELLDSLSYEMNVYFTLSVNRYCGRESLNLIIRHLEAV